MERTAMQQRVSHLLRLVDDVTSRSIATVVVVLLLLMFWILLAILGSPASWETAFAAIAGSITLTMLFVIQHTQSRHQIVLQLKLDELIRASPNADDLLVHLEVADDDELIKIEEDQLAHHDAVRGDEGLEIVKYKHSD